VAVRDGPTAAARLAVELGRLADRVETSRGWAFGKLVAAHRTALDESGVEAVQLLAWEVEEAEYLDPDNPGISVASPERGYMNAMAEQLAPRDHPTAYHYPSAAAVLDDYRAGHRALVVRMAFTGPGLYTETVKSLGPIINHLSATGQIGREVFMLGLLGRLQLVLGDLDAAAETERQGEELVPRLEPHSVGAFQLSGIAVSRLSQAEDAPRAAAEPLRRAEIWATRADTRWASAAARIGLAALLAKAGDRDEPLATLTKNLSAIERGALGALNSEVTVSAAAEILWWTGRVDHAAVIERNLRTKVLEPDFCAPGCDARWTAARLCALTNRPEEARTWFDRACQRITAQKAILLIPHVCCDEALMEIRLGRDADRANGLRQLDEARRWIDRIGLPRLLPRVGRLTDEVRSLTH
jgi:hypothetical protein